jgi:hypothetical protein
MNAIIKVKNREESRQLKAGLDDPVVRATVLVCGALKALPDARSRERALRYAAEELAERPLLTRKAAHIAKRRKAVSK